MKLAEIDGKLITIQNPNKCFFQKLNTIDSDCFCVCSYPGIHYLPCNGYTDEFPKKCPLIDE